MQQLCKNLKAIFKRNSLIWSTKFTKGRSIKSAFKRSGDEIF